MSDDNKLARLFKQWSMICKMIMDGKRDPGDVAVYLKELIDGTNEKFALFMDFGVVTVPANYDHTTQCTSFKRKFNDRSLEFHHHLTDANFQDLSDILKPGDKLWVQAFKQIVPSYTTYEERVAFLNRQDSALVGVHGALLILEHLEQKNLTKGLPRGYIYSSFGSKDKDFVESGSNISKFRSLPYIDVSKYGHLRLGVFLKEARFGMEEIILCFHKV
jgi:hypothetical protein